MKVHVERTATVTVTMNEREAAYLAALVGNVGGPDSNSEPLRMCRDLYTAFLDRGLTPPRFADVYEIQHGNGGVYVRDLRGSTGNGGDPR